MEPILKVKNISKVYRKGKLGSGTFARDFEDKVKTVYKKLTNTNSQKLAHITNNKEQIWSLKNINFQLYEGDALGIIGKNGAGKSTLLKILSRITTPTSGSIEGKGRIASLLEVGTGFHPELSGRENIFLNGAILGMKSFEIRKNFDEIVDFSGVEEFIDTPVKRYSSGMYVRLAFAVAAHLESEILIVDEVLAVGDAAFQKKCLGKMGNITKDQGRTVLFVSHNLQSIQNFCNKSMILNKGEMLDFGNTSEIISAYLKEQEKYHGIQNKINRKGDGKVKFEQLRFVNPKSPNQIITGHPLIIEIDLCSIPDSPVSEIEISIGINDQFGNRITLISNDLSGQTIYTRNSTKWTQILEINKLSLAIGNYSLNLYLASKGNIHDWIIDAMPFNVEADNYFENIGTTLGSGKGNFYLDFKYI